MVVVKIGRVRLVKIAVQMDWSAAAAVVVKQVVAVELGHFAIEGRINVATAYYYYSAPAPWARRLNRPSATHRQAAANLKGSATTLVH